MAGFEVARVVDDNAGIRIEVRSAAGGEGVDCSAVVAGSGDGADVALVLDDDTGIAIGAIGAAGGLGSEP